MIMPQQKFAVVVALLLFLCAAIGFAQQTMITQPRRISPAQYLTGDTLLPADRATTPGEGLYYFSPEQDSAFVRELRTPITAAQRFAQATRMLSEVVIANKVFKREPTPWELAMQTMDIPSAFYIPSAREVVQRQIGVANSMNVPGVLLWPMGSGNMQIGLNQIAQFFGLAEDVSPEIRYSVDSPANVEIVVYSTQARVIATLFNGPQSRGTYEIMWNGRDEGGRQMINGDYVAEVRIGQDRIVRKRIVLGGR